MTQKNSTALLSLTGVLMALLMSACSFSTAHIGSLTTSKDKEATNPTTSFASQDSIYAVATADNLPSKVMMNWRLITEKVEGQTDNTPIEQFDLATELVSDGSSTYNLSPPTAGWPPGTYKIQVTMMSDGKQQDQKSVSITVAAN